MEITKEVIENLFSEMELEAIKEENEDSYIVSIQTASIMRLKLLVWLNAENLEEIKKGKIRAQKLINALNQSNHPPIKDLINEIWREEDNTL